MISSMILRLSELENLKWSVHWSEQNGDNMRKSEFIHD